MCKKLGLLPHLVLIFVFLTLSTSIANAGKFTNTYIRLNNQAANSSIDATVCAKASSPLAGIENKITVTFPDSFTVDTNNSNWTTDTSNLPDDSSAWPGISENAVAVSGKSITFSSSDLISDSLYCFNVISLSSNTGVAQTAEHITIATINALNATIDSSIYAVAVVTNNQISVTASVDPEISDLPISMTSDSGSDISSNTTVAYTITYANNTVEPIPLTIQAQWSQGTVESSQGPSVDILEYVIGSAIKAYNSTAPIIDTVNRTITWNITNIPGGITPQTVTFKLKTNENYTGSSKVWYAVSARAISGSTVTPDAIITQYYHYVVHPEENTLTPTPTSSISISPAPTISGLTFTNIEIISLSQSSAEISISTDNDSLLNFSYGNSPNFLNSTIKTLNRTKSNILSLDKLKPDTNYYFRASATNASGKSITSDIFTFKTAIISPIPSINTNTLIATSKDNILINPIGPKDGNLRSNIIAIPTLSVFSIQFSLDKSISLKTIQALVRNKKVLGFNTVEKAEAATNYVNLVEIQPGVYTGKLDSPKPGQYEIYVRLIDFNGNILEQKIADLLVTQKFQVLEKGTNNPIENARVLLYTYNQTTKIYSVISSQILPIINPSFTDPDGSLNLVIPYGIYKAEISAIGYNPQNVIFEISPYTGGYPSVYLKNQGFNIFNTVSYFSEIVSDTITTSQNYIRSHADSSRLFDIVTTGALFIFVLITLVAFSAKTHVSLLYIPYFLLYKLRILVKKEDPLLIVGKVIDEITKLPVTRATVYLQNPQTGHVEVTLRTNRLGEFYYEEKKDRKYQVYVMKKGIITPAPILHQNKGKQVPIVIEVCKLEEEKFALLDIIIIYFEDILGMFLEFLIVLGFIFEIYFIATFGFLRIAPFILISGFTFILLLVYVYKPRIMR